MTRRSAFDRYHEELSLLGLGFQANAANSAHQYTNVRCESVAQKKSVLRALDDYGIEGRDYYNPPMHLHPFFLDDATRSARADLTVTEDMSARVVSLPVHESMDPADVDLVIEAVSKGAT